MVKYQVNMHDDCDGSENCVDVHSAKDLFRTIHLCEGGGHVKMCMMLSMMSQFRMKTFTNLHLTFNEGVCG